MRVWPLNRFLWPSPSSMFADKVAWKKGICCGECGCAGLQSGRSRCDHCVRVQHGSGSPEGSRQATVGGGRRRFAPLRRCAVGSGHPFSVGANPGEELQTVTEWPLQKPNKTKESTPSWLVLVPRLVLWSWLWMWAAGGLKKPRSLSVCWPLPAPRSEPRLMQRRVEQAWRCGGARSFPARRQNHLLRPCWGGGAGTGLRLHRMRSSATKQWLSEGPPLQV